MSINLNKLFLNELRAVLDAEELMIKVASKLSKEVLSHDLRKALQAHLKETRGQVTRIKQVFRRLNVKITRRRSLAIRALWKECTDIIKHYPKSAFRDAALIMKLQSIKHLEMSIYGTLCSYAKELGVMKHIPAQLHQTFEEEEHFDKMLTKLAKGNTFRPGINREANEWASHHKMPANW